MKVSVGRSSRLSGGGKMNGRYLDVSGPHGGVNSASGPWYPHRDEGHRPHHTSAQTETRTDNAAIHWRLRVCLRETKYSRSGNAHACESLQVCLCVIYLSVCAHCSVFVSYQHWQQTSSRWQGIAKPRQSRQNKQRCQTGQWCAVLNLMWPTKGIMSLSNETRPWSNEQQRRGARGACHKSLSFQVIDIE